MHVDAYDPRIEDIKRYVWRHYPHVATPSSCSPTPDDIAGELPPDVRDRFTQYLDGLDSPSDDTLSPDAAAVVMSVHARLETKKFIEMVQGIDMKIARCGRCERVLASPAARQCLACGFEWHNGADHPE